MKQQAVHEKINERLRACRSEFLQAEEKCRTLEVEKRLLKRQVKELQEAPHHFKSAVESSGPAGSFFKQIIEAIPKPLLVINKKLHNRFHEQGSQLGLRHLGVSKCILL